MARISELHYSNAYARTSGVSEFLEVALAPGEDPADFEVGMYDADGTQGMQVSLDDPSVRVTFDADANEWIYVISSEDFPFLLTDPTGGQDGNYEAFALSEPGGEGVINFYDIGGGDSNILATDGVAAGEVSENLAVLTTPGAATYTLQFNQPNPDVLVHETVSEGDTGAVCFVRGMKIRVPRGEVAVEDLQVGDRVVTLDHGARPVRWIASSHISTDRRTAPIRFEVGAIGNARILMVSPQHRILLAGAQCRAAFGVEEGLIAAKHLVNGSNVRQIFPARVTYFHLLFDQHELIWAQGSLSESFYVAEQSLAMLDPPTRADFAREWPDLARDVSRFGPLARPELRGRDVKHAASKYLVVAA